MPIIVYLRQPGQATTSEVQSRDLRRDLEHKEHNAREKREREKGRSFTEGPALSSSSSSKKPRIEQPPGVWGGGGGGGGVRCVWCVFAVQITILSC